MKKSLPPIVDVATLARRCGAFAGRTGLPESHVSLPVPVPGVAGLRVAVMLALAEPGEAEGSRKVRPPSHVVYALAASGKFSELAAVSPGDLGQKNDPAEPLGEILPAEDREAKRRRLLELMDEALPAFAGGPHAITGEARKAAGEIRTLFPEVAEPPLLPYYRALGKRFFAWLDRYAA